MKVQPLLLETYLATIKNSVGSKMFRAFYAEVDGKKKEVTERGNLGCGFFAAFVLKYFDLIKTGHITVDGLVRDLEASGWYEIPKPKPGAVLVWAAMEDKRSKDYKFGHKHIGFYIGKDKAVSNISSKGMPGATHWTYGTTRGKPKRAVTAIYWNKKLG